MDELKSALVKGKWRSTEKSPWPEGLLGKIGAKGRRAGSDLKRAASSRQVGHPLVAGGLDVRDVAGAGGCSRDHDQVSKKGSTQKLRDGLLAEQQLEPSRPPHRSMLFDKLLY